MPRAIVLNSASKANTTGGTMADTLTANAGDSLAVANFNTGGAKVLEAWVIDSDSVAEGQWVYTRPEATHDQQRGFRFGAQRAFNADDDRLHANTWYAILGVTAQTVCTTVSLLGPDWGGQRVGLPLGALNTDQSSWFVDQSLKWNLPLIPCFNSNNKG